jgi:gamma-glutamylcyclotransferase
MIEMMADLRETFLYFAYGSNMLTRRLTARTPSAVALGSAYVEGYRLSFNKVSTDGSGKCDIEATGNAADRVWGVLYRIAIAEAADLDDAEGLGRGYRKGEVEAVAASTKTPAAAYFAAEKDTSRLPYHWYKAFVVAGATEHALPPDYIAALRAVASQEDPKASRRAKNEALLTRAMSPDL